MESPSKDPRGFWGSRWTFTLAAVGCALGLGNLWRWPVLVENHGGGAFLAVYLVFVVVVAAPLLMAEFMLGRQYRQNPVHGMAAACQQSLIPGRWPWLARAALLAGFLVLTFYAVVGGMALAYVYKAAFGDFLGATPETVAGLFTRLRGDAVDLAVWQALFLALVMVVSIRGIHRGLARSVRVVVPIIMLLMLSLVIFAGRIGDMGPIGASLISFRWSELGGVGILEALAQAFFTIGVATGAMIMLGAYMPSSGGIRLSAWTVVAVDTLVAILATLYIFALLRPLEIEAEAGFGLLFNALPLAMSEASAGEVISSQPVTSMLFVLAALMAWSSAIIVMEPAVAWLSVVTGASRVLVVAVVVGLAWVVGMGTVLSLNHWQDATLLGHTLFGWLNLMAGGVLMPVAGIALAVFLGWVRPAWLNRQGLVLGKCSFLAWQVMMRWVVPAALGLVLMFSVGRFWADGCGRTSSVFCGGGSAAADARMDSPGGHWDGLDDEQYLIIESEYDNESASDNGDGN